MAEALKSLNLSIIPEEQSKLLKKKFYFFKESIDIELRVKIFIQEFTSEKNPHKGLIKIGCPFEKIFYNEQKMIKKMEKSESNSTLFP